MPAVDTADSAMSVAAVAFERTGRLETHVVEIPRGTPTETPFLGTWESVPWMHATNVEGGTATLSELSRSVIRNEDREAVVVAPSEDDAVTKARDARVALLARRFAGRTSTEDEARFAILTERLRRLSPRVTHEMIQRLGEMINAAEDVSEELDAIRESFELK
ncbi:MAG: hypothetical protein OEZ06_21075 [Myxococcales bacterium]|nr:hypothetical protein [Myxococcales bacterium]